MMMMMMITTTIIIDHAKLAITRFDHLKAAIKSSAVVSERIYGAAV